MATTTRSAKKSQSNGSGDYKRQLETCLRCNHIWLPREATGRPVICPKCKSPRWNEPPKAKG